jgi:hypothetical protein
VRRVPRAASRKHVAKGYEQDSERLIRGTQGNGRFFFHSNSGDAGVSLRGPPEDAAESVGVGAAIEAFASHIGCSLKIRTQWAIRTPTRPDRSRRVGRDRRRPRDTPSADVVVGGRRGDPALARRWDQSNGAGVSSPDLSEGSSERFVALAFASAFARSGASAPSLA